METLSQTLQPAFFTFYNQNNNKNVKKAGDCVWQNIAVKFILLYDVSKKWKNILCAYYLIRILLQELFQSIVNMWQH